jgi:hypothetical protein
MTSFDHPDELELSDWVDGRLEEGESVRIADHLRGCGLCQREIDRERHDLPLTDDRSFEPEIPIEFVNAFASEPPAPERGQIWQLLWDSVAELVVLEETSPDSVRAIPLEPDLELADESVVVTPKLEVLGSAMALWTSLVRDVPRRALNVCFGSVPVHVLERVDDVRSGKRAGIGAPITAVFDERAQLRVSIARRLDSLAAAVWGPGVDNPPSDTLADVARSRDLTPSRIATVLKIQPGDARAILSGSRSMDDDERDAFAILVGMSPSEIDLYRPKVDPELALALDRPKYRSRLRERAKAEGRSEANYRYWVATHGLARAARTTRTTSIDWDQLIEDFLNAR